MAVKEKKAEVVEEEKKGTVVNTMDEQEKAENKTDSKVTGGGEMERKTMEGDEEEVRLAYIGPTLPSGQLKCNKIFIGTETEIKKELSVVLEKYPLVGKMLIPANEIGEKKDKAKTAGNILHKYYTDLASSIAGSRAREG